MDKDSRVDEIVDVINKFDNKMKRSGYLDRERQQITNDAILGHKRKMSRSKEYGVDSHRNGAKGIMQRRMKRLTDNQDWFKKNRKEEAAIRTGTGRSQDKLRVEDRDDQQPISVLFIPRTPGGP